MTITLPLIARTLTATENRWADPKAFVELLTSALTVKVPVTDQALSGMTLPSGTNRPLLFILTTPTGDFSGLYAFIAGEYRQIDNYPNVGEIRGVANVTTSTTFLPGWHLANGNNGTIDRSSHFSGSSPNFSYAEIQYTGAA